MTWGERKKSEFCYHISGDNEEDACDSHTHMVYLLKKSSN